MGLEKEYAALRAADAAGDTEAAQKIAAYIQSEEARTPEEAPKKEYDLSEVPLEAVKSLVGWGERPSSALGLAGDVASAVLSPIDTGAGLGALTAGMANLVLPEGGVPTMDLPAPEPGSQKSVMGVQDPTSYPTGEGAKFQVSGTTGEDMARGVGQMYKDQYGGWEAIKRTMAEDPAIPLMDALSIATGGGALVGKAPGLIGQVGRAASAPGKVLAKTPAKLLQGPADWAGKKLYGTALKKYLPKQLGFEGQRRAIEAGRKGGYTFDEKGFNRLKKDIGGKSAELDVIIAQAEEAGEKVDFVRMWDSLDEVSDTARVSSLKPVSLQRKAQGIKGQHEALIPEGATGDYTPSEALTLKRALAAEADWSATPGSGVGTADQRIAKKAALAAKEGLESIPEYGKKIVEKNRELVPLMTARDPIFEAAIEGRAMSPHPIGGSAAARLATPAAISPAASLGALFYSPKMMASHGIAATKLADSPLMRQLINAAGPGGYVASRTTPKKRKKKSRRKR